MHGYRETGKLLFWNTKLFFKLGVSKSKGIVEYPMEIVNITEKYRRKVMLTQYEFHQYPIKICKYPISFTFKVKYPIPQKANLFLCG